MTATTLHPPATLDDSFEPARFFVLRTPLFPVSAFERWNMDLSATDVEVDDFDDDELSEALDADTTRLRARLADIFDDPMLQEAVFIASPSLAGSQRYWREDPESKRGQRVERSLVSYLGRLCTRSTPFGLFAGCAVGRVAGNGGPTDGVAERSRLALRARTLHRRVSRVDKAYVYGICEDLRRDRSLRRELTFTANDSLYLHGANYRFAQTAVDQSRLTHRLVEVERSEPVDCVLRRAAGGATVAELAAALATSDPDDDIPLDDATAFVHALIDHHLLVSSLSPIVTGDDPAREIAAQLARLTPRTAALAERLTQIRHELAAIDRLGLGVPPTRYQGVFPDEDALRQLLPIQLLQSWPEERLVQVDLLTATDDLTISRDLADQALEAASVLHRLRGPSAHADLESFRDAFVARYQDREVPLLEALDEDAGIPFDATESPLVDASPLLEGLTFPPAENPTEVRWARRENHLFRLLCRALASGVRELALTPDDLDALGGEAPLPLPDAFSIAATIVGSVDELRTGRPRLYLKWLDGPPGGRTVGRFSPLDEQLRGELRESVRNEEACRPEWLFAEIVHLPQGRAANVVGRPVLREHELTFLGRSGAADGQQIPAADVQIRVVGDEIQLRSKRLGHRVIPRLSCAHNPEANGLGLYKFLIALQRQGTSGGVRWHWGPLDAAPFLPRLTYGDVILAPARWRLEKESVEPLKAMPGAERFRAVRRLRRELRLPRVVGVAIGDEFVALDLDNILCVNVFVQMASQRDSSLLVELFLGQEDLCVESPEGAHCHELILPFVRRRTHGPKARTVDTMRDPQEPSAERRRGPRDGAARQSFGPGSPWIDVRLYCSAISADRVLSTVMTPLRAAAERWFFSREQGDDFHLRCRIHGAQERLHGEVRPALERIAGALLDEATIHRFALDTYEREVDRFGGPRGIELAEQLFWLDSELVLDLLAAVDESESAQARWFLALRGGDLLCDELGLELTAKCALASRLSDELLASFDEHDPLRHSLGARYRSDHTRFERLVAEADPTASDREPPARWVVCAQQLIHARAARGVPIAQTVRDALRENRLTCSAPELARHLLRAATRRLFATAPRAHELLIYDFLRRRYTSLLARQRTQYGTRSRP
ncbi:MAG: lantibiotic dehydratase [Acidobacteriota bacterium]